MHFEVVCRIARPMTKTLFRRRSTVAVSIVAERARIDCPYRFASTAQSARQRHISCVWHRECGLFPQCSSFSESSCRRFGKGGCHHDALREAARELDGWRPDVAQAHHCAGGHAAGQSRSAAGRCRCPRRTRYGGMLLGIVSATDLLDVLSTLTPEAALVTAPKRAAAAVRT